MISPRARTGRIAIAVALSLAGALWSTSTASAAYHFTKISEVYSDANSGFDGDYVELQAFAPGQNFVLGHHLRIYNADGTEFVTGTFGTNVANGDNQRTILIRFMGGPPDFDFTVAGMQIDAAGGAACFLDTLVPEVPIDCVAWGSWTGAMNATVAAAAGTPGPPLVATHSLTRSIAPNCATLLEDADDTNNGSVDFSLATPSPRANAVTPTETACPAPPPAPTPTAGDTTAPDTTITGGPKAKQKKGKATFSFSSNEPGSTFECKLDNGAFQGCTTPRDVQVKKGKHTFSVRAIDTAGNVDSSPATQDWTVKKKKKKQRRRRGARSG